MPHIKYILENRSNELCVGDVFQKLLNIAESAAEYPVYDSAKKKIIMKALNLHLAVERVVVSGFKLIASQLNTTGDALVVIDVWEALESAVDCAWPQLTSSYSRILDSGFLTCSTSTCFIIAEFPTVINSTFWLLFTFSPLKRVITNFWSQIDVSSYNLRLVPAGT